MHLNLGKTIFSVLGFLACWKIFFLIFSAAETGIILLSTLLLFAAYGIQSVEWIEKSSTSLFGVTIKSQATVYTQYTLFGIVPISKPRSVDVNTEYFKEIDIRPYLPTATQALTMMKSALPFGGIKSIGIK